MADNGAKDPFKDSVTAQTRRECSSQDRFLGLQAFPIAHVIRCNRLTILDVLIQRSPLAG